MDIVHAVIDFGPVGSYIDLSNYYTKREIDTGKQDKLVSGTNIKTINNQSLLGSGNINISGGSGSGVVYVTVTENSGVFTADKTFAEVDAAILSGKDVRFFDGTNYFDITGYIATMVVVASYTTGATNEKFTYTPSGLTWERTLLAPKDSPALTGTPTAPTAASGTNTTQIATTAFVSAAVENIPAGKSAYQSYVDTTTDVPVKTESEWVASLKGEDGAPGAAGPQGPKGPQGNSGYSGAAGELEVVNNLKDGGATSALSAEQGKELGNMLMTTSEAEGEETTMYGNSAQRIANKGIASDGSEVSVQWKSATPYLEIYPLSTVKFQGYSATNDYGIAFYDDTKTFIAGSWTKVTGAVQTFTAPQGARYVRGTLVSGTNASYIKYHPIVTTQVEIIPELEDRIEALEAAEVNIVDNLESSSTTDALSANQGHVIGGCIYTERGATSQTTIGQADAPNYGKGVISDGTLANTGDLAYSRYTDFIKIEGGSIYIYFSYAPTIGGLAFYTDANEASFVSFVASPHGGGAKRGYVPNNAKYFRVTFTGGSASDYFKYYAMQSVPVNQAVDKAMDATQPFIGKRIAILGDSLTWLEMSPTLYNRGWVTHFRGLLKFAELRNYARSGATWSHTASTQYDITEDTQSISNDNVIYNQLNRLINDVDNNGVTAPDFIFILAGTNDAWYPAQRPDAVADTPASVMSDESVWLNVKSIGSLTSIPKAMRYVAEMIWDKFPDCQVVVTTPLQSTAFTTDRREAIAESIKGSAEYLSWAVIEQDKVCDISRIRESQGYYMTYDGTHTSEAGAKMVGEILASQLTKILGR